MAEEFPLVIQWLNGSSGWVSSDIPMRVVLFDKDSTYADTTHRQHMVPEIRAGNGTWTDYSLAMAGDTPIEGTVRLLEMLDPGNVLVTLTGANIEAYPLLKKWLKQHRIPMDGVIMRQPGDHRANGKYKVEIIQQLLAAGYDVRLFVEDWAEVAQQVREETGVPVLVVKTEYLADAQAGV